MFPNRFVTRMSGFVCYSWMILNAVSVPRMKTPWASRSVREEDGLPRYSNVSWLRLPIMSIFSRIVPTSCSQAQNILNATSRRYSVAARRGSLAYLEPLQYKDVEGVTLLTLNRPETKNALSRQMVDEMQESLAKVAYDR